MPVVLLFTICIRTIRRQILSLLIISSLTTVFTMFCLYFDRGPPSHIIIMTKQNRFGVEVMESKPSYGHRYRNDNTTPILATVLAKPGHDGKRKKVPYAATKPAIAPDRKENEIAKTDNQNETWSIIRKIKMYPVQSGSSSLLWSLIMVVGAYYNSLSPDEITIIVLTDPGMYLAYFQTNRMGQKLACAYYYRGKFLMSVNATKFPFRHSVICPISALNTATRLGNGSLPDSVTLFYWIPLSPAQSFNSTSPNWTTPIRHGNRLIPSNTSPPSATAKHGMAICVKILYGHVNWVMLLQFIHYHRLKGVKKFFIKAIPSLFANGHNQAYLASILRYYVRSGIVQVDEWDVSRLPFCHRLARDRLCQLAQHLHCLYENMEDYEYIGMADFDELFVTANASQLLPSLLRSLDSPNVGSFNFRARYYVANGKKGYYRVRFDKNHKIRTLNAWEQLEESYRIKGKAEASRLLASILPINSWRDHVSGPLMPYNDSAKSIVKPKTVAATTSVHYISDHLPGFGDRDVTEEEGYFMHFKDSLTWPQFKATSKYTDYSKNLRILAKGSAEYWFSQRIQEEVMRVLVELFRNKRED